MVMLHDGVIMSRTYVKGRWVRGDRRGYKRVYFKPINCNCYMCEPRNKFQKSKTNRKYNLIFMALFLNVKI